ncbi:MAG: hypothetical protein PHI38_01740 [Sulfurimonas sp.]|jgi:hypothetical protein|uniref:hypothetical protein n=1 Tax=Sulfurimonas sp. TaxID=2022749 RepID=UPI002621DA6F|nr:hypothetical protein [Sulfurimonas sp.]MDD3475571.1 hypothetical protein [Sulfurimonas sp.]HUH42938.1 hypothetical protein [Sulfurimonas sp.]
MWKYIAISSLLFSGCSYFEVNFAMCENVGPNSDPSMIEKCRNYNEEEAQKAFDGTKHKSTTVPEDAIEFKKY